MSVTLRQMRPDEIGDVAGIDSSQEQVAEYALKPSKRPLGLLLSRRRLSKPAQSPSWDAHEIRTRMGPWRRYLADGATFWGAYLNHKLVGFALISWLLPDDTVELFSLFVDHAHHRGGIGSALLAKAEEETARINGVAVYLSTTLKNAAAVDFFRANGYRFIGIQDTSSVKHGGWELRMAKDLPSK